VKRGEKDVSPSPSKGHQVGVFPPPFFFFFKGVNLDHLAFFFGHNFQVESLKTCSYNFPWEENND
jgi:hypothetical protein